MKTSAALLVLPALGLGLLSGDVQAVTASAAFCKAIGPSSAFQYSAMGFANLGVDSSSTCVIPTDAALGTTVTMELRVFDNSSSAGFNCFAAVNNEVGNNAASSPITWQSTTDVFVGSQTFTWTVTVPGNVSSNIYAIYCGTIPGNFSVIYSAKAQ